MAQTKHEIQALLSTIDAEPRKRFGQNFMIDQNLVRLVADAGMIMPQDTIIEVGPGTGTLTEEILARGPARVIAVEIDRDLAGLLRDRFGSDPRFELIEGDALSGKHEINPTLRERLPAAAPAKLVANLPYNIASPLVIESLLAGIGSLAFTVQREVADRLRAGAGDDAYGPLSVMAATLSRVELLRTLPPQAFWPAPKVDSALVRMTRIGQIDSDEAREFSRFVHELFSYRRKTLRRALAQMDLDSQPIVDAIGIDPQARPETLAPEVLLAMSRMTRSRTSRKPDH